MAYRFVDLEGCAFAYDPEKVKGQMLVDLVRTTGADALLYCSMKFCEMEEFDYPFVKEDIEKVGIKMLYIEADQQIESASQIGNRIQSLEKIMQKELGLGEPVLMPDNPQTIGVLGAAVFVLEKHQKSRQSL